MERHPAREPAFEMEDDVHAVFDLSLVLFDYLSHPGRCDEERLGSLCRLSADLMTVGRRLRTHHAALCRAVGLNAPEAQRGKAA